MTPAVFGKHERTQRGAGGQIQLNGLSPKELGKSFKAYLETLPKS